MTDCIRKNKFEIDEKHQCFVIGCNSYFKPINNKTCPICNYKFCNNGHCGCSVSKETKYALDILYNTYCNLCSSKKSVVLWKLNGVEIETIPTRTPKLSWNTLTILEKLVDSVKTSLHIQITKEQPNFNTAFLNLNKALKLLRKKISLEKKYNPQSLLHTCEFRETIKTKCNRYPTKLFENKYYCNKHYPGEKEPK